MIRGNDIVPWEVLDAPYSYLDNLADCLSSTRIAFNHPERVISCSLFLVFVPIYLLAFSQARKERDTNTRAALRALLTVMAPTCSLWPNRYVNLASNLRSHIDIPFEMIINDTTNGVIELRDPINDLTDLLGSGVTVRGHTICMSIGWQWWIRCLKWWMLAKVRVTRYLRDIEVTQDAPIGQFRSDHSSLRSLEYTSWMPEGLNTANPSPTGQSPRTLTPTSSVSCLPLYIDHLPPDIIPSLNPGCKMIFEFTAFSPYLRTLSTAQMFSAIPFIFSDRLPRRPRTLTSVLKQLRTSCGPNLAIDSVSDISANYEHALCHVHGLLSGTCGTQVKSMGIKAWRRDMFLLGLEAALLRQGWIERWAIQVTAK